VFYGVQAAPLERFDINRLVLKDLVVFGALSDRRGWEQVIALVETGKLRLAPLITHRFPLDCAPQAYELVRNKAGGVVKAVLTL
jgi:threonine dehydrogenase-like Zn-dependent dehydrogenase